MAEIIPNNLTFLSPISMYSLLKLFSYSFSEQCRDRYYFIILFFFF